MSESIRNVTREYQIAEKVSEQFDPGEQPDLKRLLRQAYMHGYARALIDPPAEFPSDAARYRWLRANNKAVGSVVRIELAEHADLGSVSVGHAPDELDAEIDRLSMVIPDQSGEDPLPCSNCQQPLDAHVGIVCPQ